MKWGRGAATRGDREEVQEETKVLILTGPGKGGMAPLAGPHGKDTRLVGSRRQECVSLVFIGVSEGTARKACQIIVDAGEPKKMEGVTCVVTTPVPHSGHHGVYGRYIPHEQKLQFTKLPNSGRSGP